ncbi:MAG: AN1-type zinc finger domain-containing protein [Candidatus Helarchaeota archaeon]
MTKCSKCGKEVYMPFICNYCGEAFCAEHRLPENHNCKNIHQAVPPHSRRTPTTTPTALSSTGSSYSHETPEWDEEEGEIVDRYFEPDGTEVIVRRIPIYAIRRPENPIWYFSKLELKHLLIGILLMFGVGISMFYTVYYWAGLPVNWGLTLLLAGFATIAFLFHEFGHKFIGIRLGNWSEFRLIKIFTILTAFSVIPINPFKIVCPGAVQITGDTGKENMGKIALAGPVMNLIQATLFVIFANLFFGVNDSMFKVFIIAAYLNAFLGVFNLLPFGPLDGLKVIRWNKVFYLVTLAILISFLVYLIPNVNFY